MNLFLYLIIFIFGTTIGSFINVIVLRMKKNESFIKGRSKCQKCNKKITWQENIPILSFVFLKGKCSKCKEKISWQYIIVELMTGLLFLFAFYHLNILTSYEILILFFYLTVIVFLELIFLFDFKYFLIPDKISIPAVIVIFVFQGVLILIKDNFDFNLLITHYSLLITSGLVIGGFFWLQFVISKGKWIGGGDIRLGFLMGLILGWPNGLMALFLAYILGSIYAIPVLALKKKNLKSQVPFGTFLTLATLIVLFYGDKILNWYIKLIIN